MKLSSFSEGSLAQRFTKVRSHEHGPHCRLVLESEVVWHVLLLPQSSAISSFLVPHGWSTRITPSQSDVFARPFSFTTSHCSDIPSCFPLCCPQDTPRALSAPWFSQPGSEPKQGTDPAEKKIVFSFFFFPPCVLFQLDQILGQVQWVATQTFAQTKCVCQRGWGEVMDGYRVQKCRHLVHQLKAVRQNL